MMAKQTIPTNVTAAFELLLEEIEDEIEFVNQAGAKAFTEGQYERVDAARQHAVKLTTYRGKIATLRKEWQTLSTAFDAESDQDETEKAARRDFGRLQRGVRTPEEAFRLPILQVLVKMGGSGKVRDILAQVEKLVNDQLSDADYQPLPPPLTPRAGITRRNGHEILWYKKGCCEMIRHEVPGKSAKQAEYIWPNNKYAIFYKK